MATLTQLFTAKAATGASSAISHNGGKRSVVYEGTWDSASLVVQMSPDSGSTWVAITDATFTADGATMIDVPSPCELRFSLTVTGTTSIDAWM